MTPDEIKALSTEELKRELRRQHDLAAGMKVQQEALKVMLNSLYGAAGNVWFRYYDLRIAEGVTRTGQAAIMWIQRAVNEYLNKVLKTTDVDYCLAIDTDSTYFTLEPLVRAVFKERADDPGQVQAIVDFLDKVAKKVETDVIKPAFVELAEFLNCREKVLEMKREAISSAGFWIRKKRYALDVYDMEGVRYAVPELKVMGLELIKSSTPEFCRDKLEEAVKIILRQEGKDRLAEFVAKTKEEFMKLEPEQFAASTTVSEIDKWVADEATMARKSGTPIGSAAAITYNMMVSRIDTGTGRSFEKIRPGDKVYRVPLCNPRANPAGSHVIGFTDYLPKEFGLHKWVDREAAFENTFLTPLRNMADVLKIGTTLQADIADFFE